MNLFADVSESVFDLSDFNQSTAPDFKLLDFPDFLGPDFSQHSFSESTSSERRIKLSQEVDIAFDSSDIIFPFHTFL